MATHLWSGEGERIGGNKYFQIFKKNLTDFQNKNDSYPTDTISEHYSFSRSPLFVFETVAASGQLIGKNLNNTELLLRAIQLVQETLQYLQSYIDLLFNKCKSIKRGMV